MRIYNFIVASNEHNDHKSRVEINLEQKMILFNPSLAYVAIPSAFLTNELSELLRNARVLNPPLKGWMRAASLQRHSKAPEPLKTAVYRGRKTSFTATLASIPTFYLLLRDACLFHKCHFTVHEEGAFIKDS